MSQPKPIAKLNGLLWVYRNLTWCKYTKWRAFWLHIKIFIAPQRSWGKVMFLQVSFSLSSTLTPTTLHPSLFHSNEIEVVSDTNMLYETSIPWNWVHWSPLNVITRERAPSTVPLSTMLRLYLRLVAQHVQFVSGSNPNTHPVCTSGLCMRTFDPDFTPIGFALKKQHQLLCCMFSTATPVH